MFDYGGPYPQSYVFTAWTCLMASLIALPAGFAFLCWKMRRIPDPPFFPYFCIFGTVGGFLLIVAFSPSFLTYLIFPLLICAPVALLASAVYLAFARAFTAYHLCAFVGCILLLLAIFFFWTSDTAA